MEFEIKTGNDGREYAVFTDEDEATEYCDMNNIEADLHCFDGYLNSIFLDDIATE